MQRVEEMKALAETFENWGMKKGDAISLAIPLVYPHALMGEETLTSLVYSFRSEPACIQPEPSQSAAHR